MYLYTACMYVCMYVCMYCMYVCDDVRSLDLEGIPYKYNMYLRMYIYVCTYVTRGINNRRFTITTKNIYIHTYIRIRVNEKSKKNSHRFQFQTLSVPDEMFAASAQIPG